MSESGELVLGRRANEMGGGHIDLAHGAPVQAAGEVLFVKGQVRMLDNTSGHYLPSGPRAQSAAEAAFEQAGFDVAGRYIEKTWNGNAWVPK